MTKDKDFIALGEKSIEYKKMIEERLGNIEKTLKRLLEAKIDPDRPQNRRSKLPHLPFRNIDDVFNFLKYKRINYKYVEEASNSRLIIEYCGIRLKIGSFFDFDGERYNGWEFTKDEDTISEDKFICLVCRMSDFLDVINDSDNCACCHPCCSYCFTSNYFRNFKRCR